RISGHTKRVDAATVIRISYATRFEFSSVQIAPSRQGGGPGALKQRLERPPPSRAVLFHCANSNRGRYQLSGRSPMKNSNPDGLLLSGDEVGCAGERK